MLKKVQDVIINDTKGIVFNIRFLIALLILVWLSFLHSLLFPVFSDYFYTKSGLRLEEYYALFTVTCISAVPILIGSLYGKIIPGCVGHSSGVAGDRSPEDQKYLLLTRIMASVLLSFLIVIVSIIIIKPVHAQGWLRSLSAAMLLSFQSSAILLSVALTKRFRHGKLYYRLFITLLLVALPLGVLFHHPWNYLTFFSPFYWIAWEWLIVSPSESIMYGAIALVMSSGILIVLLRKFSGKLS